MNYIRVISWAFLCLIIQGAPLAGAPQIRIEPQTVVFSSLNNRTIYVELDWMEDVDHTHKPSQQVIDRIVQTFAAEGYAIIIELGNAIPHQDMIMVTGSPSGSAEVQAIRNEHFAHRNDPRYFYSIWGHTYNSDPPGSSGLADLPGRIHLVTLGTFPGQVGSFQHQVGTFIHELGHNIGQRHGGADHSNYKPNYISVMNYHFQLSGIGPILFARGLAPSSSGFNDFGYSHGALPDLNEALLDERVGIGLGRAVDWNCDGDTLDAIVSRDIQASDWCSASGGLSVISDFDNWGSINSFVQGGSSIFNIPPDESPEPCIGWEQHQAFLQTIGPVPESSPPPLLANAPAAVDPGPGITIYNDGQSDLVVTAINKVTPADWISSLPAPPFTIAPGGSRFLLITVDFTRAPVGRTTNHLEIISNDPNGNADVTVVVVNQSSTANLSAGQTVSSDPASVGCPLTYTLDMTNFGPTAASSIVISNQLPLGVTLVSAASTAGNLVQTASNVVVTVGSLLLASNVSVTVTVTPNGPASLTNRVFISAAQVDPVPDDNSSTLVIPAVIDTTPPSLVEISTQPDGDSLLVQFSEVVSGESLNPSNYFLLDGETNGVPILAVQPGPNPRSVLLQAELLTRFSPFTLTVSNLTDCLGNPMLFDNVRYVRASSFTFLPAGSVWRYLDDGSDQGVAWRTLVFNDGSWKTGRAQFGYGEDDERTEVSFGPDSNLKHVTTYFRTTFVVPDASKLTNGFVDLLRDDGAVVYLNGTEIVRSNMPSTSTSSTLASTTVNEPDEFTFFQSRFNSALFRTGTNVLAVEVHQSSRNSSDLSFDLALGASLRALNVRPAVGRPPQSQIALVGDTVTFNVSATGTPPLGYRWRFNNRFIEPAYREDAVTLVLTNVVLTNAGQYAVAITNPATASFLSPLAYLEIMEDNDGDRVGDAWETRYGLSTNNPSDASSDADGDTVSNRDEFLTGTDPNDPQSFLKVDRITAQNNATTLQFTAASNRNYSVLYRDDNSAAWKKLADALGRSTNRIETIVDPHSTNKTRLYRLRSPIQP